MSNYIILRKLETYELNKNRSDLGPNFLITFQVRSRIDLFSRLDSVRAAIQTWKSMHTFLRTQVVKLDDEFHFVIDENSSANQNLENVHFLCVKSKSIDAGLKKSLFEQNLLYDLVLERSMGDAIDWEKGSELLWRLIILELRRDDARDSGEIVYEFIWHLHHIIGDGISAKENVPLLLNIIHKTLKGENIEKINDYDLYPGTTIMFAEEMELALQQQQKQQQNCKQIGETANTYKFIKPDFVDPEKSKQHARSVFDHHFDGIDLDKIEFELIDLNSGRLFANLTQLVHFYKEINNVKPRNYIIYEEAFEKLVKKCKQENIKMTSCLNMINIIALLRLFKRHNYKTDVLGLYSAVNLRQFRLPTVINNFQMCYCVGALVSAVRDEFGSQVDDDQQVLNRFWQLTRNHAVVFDERVRNDPLKFANPTSSRSRKFDDDEMLLHLGVSNMGIMETDGRVYECFRCDDEKQGSAPFKIENTFVICTFGLGSMSQKYLFFNYMMTVNKRLCCSISNNSYYFDYLFVDEFIDFCKDLHEKLIA